MYDSLLAHEQKVHYKDSVKHEDLTNALAAFQNQLTLVRAAAIGGLACASAATCSLAQLAALSHQSPGCFMCAGCNSQPSAGQTVKAELDCVDVSCRAWSSLLTTRRSRA